MVKSEADAPSAPLIAGISGGRTSALMAFMIPPEAVLTFQNTGREHEKTLEFLRRLEDDLKRPIIRLEWRPPPRRGDPPRMSSLAVVSHSELSRKGEPFTELLESLKAYRATKGEPPIAPWAARRLCTAYLKMKVQHRYAQSLGWEAYTCYVGIRADEPDRVRSKQESAYVDVRYPLFEAGVTKGDVLAFWGSKTYDLEIPEHLGNCTACFMKDERDLATALLEPSTDAAWWVGIEDRFAPMRRGGRPSYAQVLAEAPARMSIRHDLAMGLEPSAPPALSQHRFKLIVRQEKKPKAEAWSCSCESAMAFGLAEDVDD
jgi:hypothetical protein